MTKIAKYNSVLTLMVVLIIVGCKKSAELQIHVYNEDVHVYTPDATVTVIERHIRKSINPYGFGDLIYNCKVVATAKTNENGIAIIDYKIKSRNNFDYILFVSNAWGKEYQYSCGSGGNGYKSNDEVYLNDKTFRTGSIIFQINNLSRPEIGLH